MKFFVMLMVISFSIQSFANSLACVDRATAEKSLTMFIANDSASIYDMSIDEYFENHVMDNSDTIDFVQWLAEFQDKAVQKLKWNATNNQYETDVMWSFECAASASCWGGFIVDCDGGTTGWFEGEE